MFRVKIALFRTTKSTQLHNAPCNSAQIIMHT